MARHRALRRRATGRPRPAEILTPPLPPGRFVQLDGAAPFWSATSAGRPGAPTVVLLHGWTATADLNWFRCYAALGEHFRVVAFDHRGHGTRHPIAARRSASRTAPTTSSPSADVLGIERFIAVGYSMGGPIAQLLWRRHPELVDGLVLCATVGVVLRASARSGSVPRPRRARRPSPASRPIRRRGG